MNVSTWDIVAAELVRAIRSGRSQVAFARRLGYRSNVAADWEAGHRFPSATRFLEAAARCGCDVAGAMDGFHPRAAADWRESGIPAWLRALGGHTSHADTALRAGATRHQVGRWLRGDADPRLPQLLALVDALTGRVSDWVGGLVALDRVPALHEQVRGRHEVLRLAYEDPWSAAVLVCLAALPPGVARPAAAIAGQLELDETHVDHLLDVMARGGVLDRRPDGLRILRPLTVDVPPDGDVVRVRRHWAGVSADRGGTAAPGDRFSFNVCAVSAADLERLLELQAAYFRELRSIVAASEPPEVVALITMHTTSWPRPPLP